MAYQKNGKVGEYIAEKFLESRGYEILERNYKKKVGEIDLIANFEEYIIFIEVKLRISIAYGTPSEYVNKKKQTKIIKTAQIYLNGIEKATRFDVIQILKEGNKYHIEHIKNAFGINS
ncbi:MAG: YraN family protein [Defluviitaleaceae bacterium]|nr:YraN family protein [Defluviitaleaceae bacterium]